MNENGKEYMSESEARKIMIDIGKRMYSRGVVAANDGNISILIGKNQILCTPTGVSKGFMNEEDLIVIDFEENIIKGSMAPSSEMKMHIEVYKNNETAMSVVHAHPINATALAVSGISLMEPILTESVVVLGPIPLAPYATAGTPEVAEAVSPYCRDYNGVILANHGAAVWAETPMKAWYRMESLEQVAEIYIKSKFIIGKATALDDDSIEKLKERYGL